MFCPRFCISSGSRWRATWTGMRVLTCSFLRSLKSGPSRSFPPTTNEVYFVDSLIAAREAAKRCHDHPRRRAQILKSLKHQIRKFLHRCAMPVVIDGDRMGRTLPRIAHEILERNRGMEELAL